MSESRDMQVAVSEGHSVGELMKYTILKLLHNIINQEYISIMVMHLPTLDIDSSDNR